MKGLFGGASGRTSIAHLTKETLVDIEVPHPLSVREQQKIAEILDAADELIDEARRLLKKSIIVQAAGVSAFISMWEVKSTLGEVLAEPPKNGLYKPSSEYVPGGIPIIRIDSIRDGGIEQLSNLKRVRISASEALIYGVEVEDILINRVNSIDFVGKSAMVRDLPEPVVIESNIMRCRVNPDRARAAYVALWLTQARAMAHFKASAKSAVAQASINQSDVRACPIALPSIYEQDSLVMFADQARETETSQRAGIAKLSLLKQGLMDDLLTGGYG